MTSKRKSVTFRENLSEVYPNSMDGTSPNTLTKSPISLDLDPMYLAWLRSATKAQYPFIVDGTFAKHIHHQNFNRYHRLKSQWHQQLKQQGEVEVAPLAEKYGSLGWGSLYRKISEEAWVKNYREIYRFNGSDEQLLEKIAEAYAEIKHTIAQEKHANAHLAQDGSTPHPPSARQWTAYTQAAGALVSPDFGPSGVTLPFGKPTENALLGKEAPAQHRPRVQEAYGDVGFDMGVASGGFGNAMTGAGSEMRMYGAGPGPSGLRYQTR